MGLRNNYYFSSFFWSTFQKIINAIVGFISVPLLLGYYGKAEYGILGIATACNGYMHLLDLGMNTGAVKYFSQWRTEGNNMLINRVARTNITFYGIISIINIFGLIALAIWGESFFSVTHDQFLQLRSCLYIIALFCVLSWGTTTFNQLLVAHMQMAYTMQIQSVMALLKGLLIAIALLFSLTLTQYFFLLTGIVALLIVPYAAKCRRIGLIDSLKPAFFWSDFKVVLMFSLSIFALSLFQMTSTQSRPILLSIFATNGAEAVAEFRIIEVVPQLIIMICGTFSSIFLPKASELVVNNNQVEISRFSYKWTIFTTILANCICFPFLLGAGDVINAYVGNSYEYLSIWLMIWVVCVLLQVHSTPTNALILAKGKTKIMVYISAIACIISMVINAVLAKQLSVGSAVVGYFVYIIINLFSYYMYYYKKILRISIISILYSFLYPTLLGTISFLIAWYICCDIKCSIFDQERFNYIIGFVIKASLWAFIFVILLLLFRVVWLKEKKLLTKFDY